MILKQIIKYQNAHALEATWVVRQQMPDVEVPESFGPTTRDEGGNVVPGELIPAHVIPGEIVETVVRCHVYSNAQMDQLRADLGDDVELFEALIAEVQATYVPPESQPPAVPAAVTMRQARLALLAAGLLDDVDAAIAAIPDAATRRAAQIEWEFSNELQRGNPFVATLGAALGLTPDEVDSLFVEAAQR